MEATDFVSGQAAAGSANLPSGASVTHLTGVAVNATSSFLTSTSPKDLALLPLRLVVRLDRVLFRTIPDFIIRSTGLNVVTERAGTAWAGYWNPAGTVAGAGAGAGAGVGTGMADVVGGAEAGAIGAGTAAAAAAAAAANAGETVVGQAAAEGATSRWATLFAEGFQNSTFKSYWGMLHYLASRWALTCFFMALVLNRVNVYGRSRQRIYLTWTKRLALRLVPIILFFTQIRQLTQAIRCQTSPEFALYRHGDIDKYSLLDWSIEGGTLHQMTSIVLWGSDDQAACAAVGMSRPEPGVKASRGSFALLWPTFLRLSLSHFVENLSCALQQIPVMTEVGMSVFEHSLAFAEAETMISHTLNIGMFGSANATKDGALPNDNTTQLGTIPASGTLLAISDAASSLTAPHILDRVNVPVEVLLVALLSCCNAFTSHLISVAGKQNKLRLINTSFWGCCFMASFTWGLWATSPMVRIGENGDSRPVSGLLHFPTVAIVGFLPHMTILFGIWICLCIYLVALLLTAVSLGTNPRIRQPSRLSERISIAHDNLQAAVQVKGITVRWAEDFYTALLRAGFAALTAASEAVFLHEGRSVEMRQFTWLEEERMDELELSRLTSAEGSQFTIAEEVCLPPAGPGTDDRGRVWESGYAKERKIDDKNKDGQLRSDGTFVYPNPRTDGVGALQRTTRFYLLFIFIRGIMFTVAGWTAYGIGVFFDRIGITSRPRWLRRFVGKSLKRMEDKQKKSRGYGGMKMLDFWLIDDEGKSVSPQNDDVDIEPVMRQRLMDESMENTENIDSVLDERLYNWWKIGGWFGAKDASGDYMPESREPDEDLTSVVSESVASLSEAGGGDDDEDAAWESEPEGRRTPTQQTTAQSWSFSTVGRDRSPTPDIANDNPLDAATLARYLNPPDRESRLEARILASHLTSGASGTRIMTRSRYRQELDNERSRVLLAGRTPIHPLSASAVSTSHQPRALTPLEEAEGLEELLLTRRRNKAKKLHQTGSAGGGEDEEANRQTGPPCVVCQSEPRTIIAWPCRCLCICEDCRVTLAMNNYSNCVTCRRNVGGFVRLYVP